MNRLQLFEVARNLPMSDTMDLIGATQTYISKTGKNDVYVTQSGQEVIVNGYGWIVRGEGNGCGAVDLIMSLSGCDKEGAVNYLRPLTGAPYDIASVLPVRTFIEAVRKAKIKPSEPSMTFPLPDDSRWSLARDYLTQKRGLADALVDELHDGGLIYASPGTNTKFTNAVFVGALGSAGDAVEYRGIVDGERKFRGRFGVGAWFCLPGNDVDPVAVVESAIEAMSLRQLGYMGMIVSSGGGFGGDLIEQLKLLDRTISAATNNDGIDDERKGGAAATKLNKQFGSDRLKPVLKDWNDCLRAGLNLASATV